MSRPSHTKELLKRREVSAHNSEIVSIIYRCKARYGISVTDITPVWRVPHFHDSKRAGCNEVVRVRREGDRLDCTFMLLECPVTITHFVSGQQFSTPKRIQRQWGKSVVTIKRSWHLSSGARALSSTIWQHSTVKPEANLHCTGNFFCTQLIKH
jgi:hypothetical protein